MIHKADKELKAQWADLFNSLPLDSRIALKTALKMLHESSLEKANHCWLKHKAPMALYHKVVGVYSGHLARAIRV